jgi:hypothetical protein
MAPYTPRSTKIRRLLFFALLLAIYHLTFVSPPKTKGKYDKIAVFIFSGVNISHTRLPAQVSTFLTHLPPKNWQVLGDSSLPSIDDTHEMQNVISEFYPFAKSFKNPEVGKIGFKQPKGQDEFRLPTVFNDDWHLNAYKFLPSLVLARRMLTANPDLEWFLLMDDDTYPLLGNILHEVKSRGYDPDDAWYLGNAYRFVGCDEHTDNTTPKDRKPLMGNVGAGVLLSRGTIRRVSEWEVGKCTEKFKECWAGSVRIALCLAELGIYLGWIPKEDEKEPKVHDAKECMKLFFRAEPPVDPTDPNAFGQFWPNPCYLPLSFHHLPPNGMKKLFDAEKESELVDFGQVWHAIFDQSHRFRMAEQALHMNGVDFPGSDISFHQVASKEECRNLCRADVRCGAVSMIVNGAGGGCNLKKGVPRLDKSKENSWSWVNVENYKCNPELLALAT